jgi:hypothetical protein
MRVMPLFPTALPLGVSSAHSALTPVIACIPAVSSGLFAICPSIIMVPPDLSHFLRFIECHLFPLPNSEQQCSALEPEGQSTRLSALGTQLPAPSTVSVRSTHHRREAIEQPPFLSSALSILVRPSCGYIAFRLRTVAACSSLAEQ